MRPEFEHETAAARLLLERVPAEPAAWKQHPKSMSLGELPTRLADVPFRVQPTTRAESFDAAPPARNQYGTPRLSSREEAVERLDRNVAWAGDAISGTDDAQLMDPWSLRCGAPRPGSRNWEA